MSRSWYIPLLLLIPFITLLAGCQPVAAIPISQDTPAAQPVQMGPLQQVSNGPYLFEPHIAVDPTNPDHLVAVVISTSAADFRLPDDPAEGTQAYVRRIQR